MYFIICFSFGTKEFTFYHLICSVVALRIYSISHSNRLNFITKLFACFSRFFFMAVDRNDYSHSENRKLLFK